MVRQAVLNLLTNGTLAPPTSGPASEAPYDHSGAMWFVVTVVSVYAMAILFMIVSHINRRSGKRELDREVSAFLRSAPAVRIEEERQHRRNLKRAMQPFIRLALDRRTVGVQVGVAPETDDLVTLASAEALHGATGTRLLASSERLTVGHRLVSSSRRSSRSRRRKSSGFLLTPPDRSRRSSAEAGYVDVHQFLENSGEEDDDDSDSCGERTASAASATIVGHPNEKAVQCALNARQSLASRAQFLRPAVSDSDLGSSASFSGRLRRQEFDESPSMDDAVDSVGQSLSRSHWQALMELEMEQQQQHQQPHTSAARVSGEASASRTHVPRFLAAF